MHNKIVHVHHCSQEDISVLTVVKTIEFAIKKWI